MHNVWWTSAVAAIFLSSVVDCSFQPADCDPNTCTLPACRCCNTKVAPGNLSIADIPQIVMVSFQGAIDTTTANFYKPLLDLTNPNGCKATGTFFVKDEFSDYAVIKKLYDEGHEIGIQSVDGKPSNASIHWSAEFKKVIDKLVDVGIEKENIKGVRLPELQTGGDDEFNGIGDNGLEYDSTCSSVLRSRRDNLIWPCTMGFPETNMCDIGQTPVKAFPDVWEVMLAPLHDLTDEGLACLVPSACRGITSKQDAFDLLYKAFEDHFQGSRTPFNMVIDAAWPQIPELLSGTVEFLQYIRAAMSDSVWVVSISKAIEWVKQPTRIADLKDFGPWQC